MYLWSDGPLNPNIIISSPEYINILTTIGVKRTTNTHSLYLSLSFPSLSISHTHKQTNTLTIHHPNPYTYKYTLNSKSFSINQRIVVSVVWKPRKPSDYFGLCLWFSTWRVERERERDITWCD